MGPSSKDAVVRALGHIIDELLQQREVGRKTLEEVKKLVRAQETQAAEHEALKLVVSERRATNGNRP